MGRLLARASLAVGVVVGILPSAFAGLSFDGFGGYGAPYGSSGPYEANTPGWLKAVNASNSTGLFKIPGYDVSQPYPGKPIDGWTLSLAAVDVDLPGTQYINDKEVDNRMIGYSLTLQAPDSLLKHLPDGSQIVNVDKSWGMCFWNWEAPNFTNKTRFNNPTSKPLNVDGSCTGFLSDACIAALEKVASTNYYYDDQVGGDYNSTLRCSDMDTPKECGEFVGGSVDPLVNSFGVPIQYLNGSVTFQDGWTDMKEENFTTQDMKDAWDSLVVNFWPVLTLLVHNNGSSNSTILHPEPGLAKMSCVAPDGVGTGKSFTFSGNVTSATTGGDKKSDAVLAISAPLGWLVSIIVTGLTVQLS